MVLPLIASLLPAVIGAGAGLIGQSMANQETAASTAKQMEFQERMSNTQYQRGMADMRAAGLNPILAYKQGGASAPTGASYTAANVGQAAAQGAQSAQAAARSAAETNPSVAQAWAGVDLTNAQIRQLMGPQAELLRAQAAASMASSARDVATARLTNFEAARAAADEEFFSSSEGKSVRQAGRVISELGPLGSLLKGFLDVRRGGSSLRGPVTGQFRR